MTSLSEVLHDRVMEKHPGLMRGNVIDQLFGVEFTTTCVSSVVGCCSLVFGLRTDHPHTGVRFLRRLTCGECEGEPPVIQKEIARKVVCNIEGGAGSTVQINHLTAGIELVGKVLPSAVGPQFLCVLCYAGVAFVWCVFKGLVGSLEKQSAILGRNAVWSRHSKISRLPKYLCVQLMRFYWKPTPESREHAGVKCKMLRVWAPYACFCRCWPILSLACFFRSLWRSLRMASICFSSAHRNCRLHCESLVTSGSLLFVPPLCCTLPIPLT
jgi:hypothetical protein